MNFFTDLWYAFANGFLYAYQFFINHWWWIFGIALLCYLVYEEFKDVNEQIIDEDRELI